MPSGPGMLKVGPKCGSMFDPSWTEVGPSLDRRCSQSVAPTGNKSSHILYVWVPLRSIFGPTSVHLRSVVVVFKCIRKSGKTMIFSTSVPKLGPTSVQSGPKLGATSVQSGPKLGPNSVQSGPKLGPTSVQMLADLGPDSVRALGDCFCMLILSLRTRVGGHIVLERSGEM